MTHYNSTNMLERMSFTPLPVYQNPVGPSIMGRQAKGFGNMAFTFTNSYLQGVYENVCAKNTHEPEFLQAVGEVLESLQPVFNQKPELARAGVIERMVEPERSLLFRISWVDDHGQVQVNRGYRVQNLGG